MMMIMMMIMVVMAMEMKLISRMKRRIKIAEMRMMKLI
jgi:hypothetical protein